MKEIKTTLRQKIALIIFGLTFVLVVVELFLRIIGVGYLLYRRGFDKDIAKGKSNVYKILCLGDSFTLGVGTGKGQDYPSQLENKLNQSKLGKEFQVINEGIGGQNSSELLYSLDRNLDRYKPDMVILMTGMNDGHNTHLHNWSLGQRGWYAELSSWITGLRVYKLFKFAWVSIRKPDDGNESEFKEVPERKNKLKQDEIIQPLSFELQGREGPVNRIIELFERSQNKEAEKLLIETVNSENVWEYINLAKKYNAFDTVERIIKRALEDNPDDEWLHFTLGQVYLTQGKVNEAEKVFKYIRENNPDNNYIGFSLAWLYLAQKRYSEAESLVRNEIETHGESLEANQLLLYINEAQGNKKTELDEIRKKINLYEGITEFNMRNIKIKILSKGISLIIMSYPRNNVFYLSKEIMDELVSLDNESVFNNLPKFEQAQLFSADNHHCNAMGYKIIAENVFNYIIKK